MQVVYAVLFALVLGGVFALSYYMNKKTPKPAGCEDLTAECHGCAITSCEHHPNNELKGI